MFSRWASDETMDWTFGSSVGPIGRALAEASAAANREGRPHWVAARNAVPARDPLRLFEAGYTALYIPATYGRGLMPDTFADFQKQRFRWAYGAILIMRHHLASLLGLKKTRLTWGQRYHFLAGWLPWLADGANLFFNLAALVWSLAMIIDPLHVDPPLVVFSILPLADVLLLGLALVVPLALMAWRQERRWRGRIAGRRLRIGGRRGRLLAWRLLGTWRWHLPRRLLGVGCGWIWRRRGSRARLARRRSPRSPVKASVAEPGSVGVTWRG